MKTKFGNASYNGRYMKIHSRKEGNENKSLHRLIFEDFYNIKLPSNIIIHHDDGNRLNNEIWNLVPMTVAEHNRLHHKGKGHSNEAKLKISNAVKGENNPFYGRHHSEETKQILSEKNSGENSLLYGVPLNDSHKRDISLARNTTGYRNVHIQKCSSCKQGFRYRYTYMENRKIKAISSISLEVLERKVLARNLPWEKFEEEFNMKVKNIALENEGMADRIAFLENVVDQQREYIAEIEAENTVLIHNVATKRRIIEGLKFNNGELTLERNKLIDELTRYKNMSVFEFCSSLPEEKQVEAGRQLAKSLLGGR